MIRSAGRRGDTGKRSSGKSRQRTENHPAARRTWMPGRVNAQKHLGRCKAFGNGRENHNFLRFSGSCKRSAEVARCCGGECLSQPSIGDLCPSTSLPAGRSDSRQRRVHGRIQQAARRVYRCLEQHRSRYAIFVIQPGAGPLLWVGFWCY